MLLYASTSAAFVVIGIIVLVAIIADILVVSDRNFRQKVEAIAASTTGIKITNDMTAQDVERKRAFRRAERRAIGFIK